MKKRKIASKIYKTVKKRVMSNNEQDNSGSSDRARHADTIIRNHIIWSMGAGFIPILVADIFAVSALQLDMVRQMAKIYNVDFKETQGKAIVTSLTGSTLARVGARSLIKLIPGVGSLLGGVTVSVFAGASTFALGEVFKQHFESGGTILDFDPSRLRKFYQEKFEKGKKVAEDLGKKGKAGVEYPIEPKPKAAATDAKPASAATANPAAANPEMDVLSRLKELGELKESGVISEEEFDKLKKKLIEEF